MEWILEETSLTDFGDKRLKKRLSNVLDALGNKPTPSIPTACKGWHETKAAYRFLSNERVTFERILLGHQEATMKRIEQESTVLLIQDTTELDYTSHPSKKEMGFLNYKDRTGLYLHPTIAVTPSRLCLGVVRTDTICRETLRHRDRSHKQRPIEEKETYCWLQSYRAAQGIAEQCENTCIVSIADREGDIYELLLEGQPTDSSHSQAHWIIRANQNRSLLSKDGQRSGLKLREQLKQSTKLGEVSFELPGREGGKARTVTQQIKARRVTLRPPPRQGKPLPPVQVNVVLCEEMNVPDNEKAIEWYLLTSLPINTLSATLKIVEWYLCRWQIEVYFRILKSGCRVEELQLQTKKRLLGCLALYMIVAWRVLFITMIERSNPEETCEIVFEEPEWKSVYMVIHKKPPPKEPPTLKVMIRLLAELGGFLNRKQDGNPGPQTIWIGLQRTHDFALAWEAFQRIQTI